MISARRHSAARLRLAAGLTLSAFVTLLAPAALAQHRTFTVNPEASSVKIALPGTGHTTEGTFHVEQGSVQFDAAPGPLSGMIAVSAASGRTGNDTRDKHMATEVLEAAKFSEITFAPQTYTGTLAATGDSTIQVTGIFTLHGAPHLLTVPMQMHIEGNKLTAHTSFKVPYVQWGLKDPSIMFLKVAKEVQIELTLVGSL
jgi:polyisoprenoid-binding protein YceI